MEAVAKREIKFLTLWASSFSNLRERSGSFREVMNLFYARKFNDLAKSQKFFTILVGYDGKRERGAAVIKLVNDLLTGRLASPQSINEAELELKKEHGLDIFLM